MNRKNLFKRIAVNFNTRWLCRTFGITMSSMGFLLVPCIFYSLFLEEINEVKGFFFTCTISLFLGYLLIKMFPVTSGRVKIRDGYLGIILSVVIAIIIGAMPYILANHNMDISNALFESTAGLTTTSATVIGETKMARSLLFWKTLQHWAGGIGLLIFLVAIMPLLGSGEQQLATAESQTTNLNKIAPRYRTIINYLVKIYFVITLTAFIYFLACRIGFYDALILALCCTSTSGVLLHPEGISFYQSTLVELGVAFFCILGGTSFVLYILLIKKHFHDVKRNVEVKVFLSIIAISTLILFSQLVLWTDKNIITALKEGFLQASSFATTSGFAVEDYTLWSSTSIYLLFILLLIGGCSSSTTGALKVIRVIIDFQLIRRGVFKRIHPRAVKPVKVGKSIISAPMASAVTTFSILYFFTFVFATVVISLADINMETAVSATIGALSNNGISFGRIGMSGDYSMFSWWIKLFISIIMIIGRLGLIPIFLLFMPSFWTQQKGVHRIQS